MDFWQSNGGALTARLFPLEPERGALEERELGRVVSMFSPEVTGGLGANPAAVLVDGHTPTAEVIGGLGVLSVFAVHTAEAGNLGVGARNHSSLEFPWLLLVWNPPSGEWALCTVAPPRMGLKVGAEVPPSTGGF